MPSVLVVDDEATLRFAIGQILVGAGYEVISVESVSEALEALRAQSVDVILCDVVMPGQDGLQLLPEVRDAYPDTPVIMITGYNTLQPAIQAMREGALNYLLKPIGKSQLIECVQEGMQVRQERIRKREMKEQLIANLQALDLYSPTIEAIPSKRKAPPQLPEESAERFLQIRDLTIDQHRLVALYKDQLLELTPTEFEILYCLVQASGRVVTFEELAHHLRGIWIERDEARTMFSSHFANLRAKLAEANCASYLVNSRSNGYFIRTED